MTISGERTKQLDMFCRVTGFTSDFLSFIVVELIRFFHGAIQLLLLLCYHSQFVFNWTVHFRVHVRPGPPYVAQARNFRDYVGRFSAGCLYYHQTNSVKTLKEDYISHFLQTTINQFNSDPEMKRCSGRIICQSGSACFSHGQSIRTQIEIDIHRCVFLNAQ